MQNPNFLTNGHGFFYKLALPDLPQWYASATPPQSQCMPPQLPPSPPATRDNKECFLELPVWNYDGSSTGQADGTNSEVFLYPVAIYKDPFRQGNNRLVLCDTYKYNKKPSGMFHMD